MITQRMHNLFDLIHHTHCFTYVFIIIIYRYSSDSAKLCFILFITIVIFSIVVVSMITE